MQFAAGSVSFAAASDTLVEEELPTGLTIRGGYAWLIHFFEFQFSGLNGYTADIGVWSALSVTQGLAALPNIDDAGTISRIDLDLFFTTSGGWCEPRTRRDAFLPPLIIANPKLSVYLGATSDMAGFQNQECFFRIGYTTVPIDQRSYLEIAETWEVI